MHFQEETLYLGIHLLNRSLREVKVSTVNLQLLGMVCLFLAAKKEECLLPEVSWLSARPPDHRATLLSLVVRLFFLFQVSGLCYLMDHTYTKHQLLRMERKVLFGLKFDLSYCPPLHFLLLLASVARCSAKVEPRSLFYPLTPQCEVLPDPHLPPSYLLTQAVWMARYLLELSLLEGQCVVFLPVQLAGAALFLSRQVLQEPPTPGGEAAWCLAASVNVGRCVFLGCTLIQCGPSF